MTMPPLSSRLALVLFALGLLLTFVAGASSGKKTKYDLALPVPAQPFRHDTVCGVLGGDVTAGDFFRGLERRETADGIEFRRKSQVIHDFPAELSVVLSGTIGSCPTSVPNSVSAASLTNFINQLKIAAEWSNGAGARPVSDISVIRHAPPEVWWPETDAPHWKLEIKVPSKDVPLTDSLSISIQSEDGHRLMDFTVAL